MIIFASIQLVLSQIPNFHDLAWLSILAAIMSFAYASIGVGLSIARVVGTFFSLTVSPFRDSFFLFCKYYLKSFLQLFLLCLFVCLCWKWRWSRCKDDLNRSDGWSGRDGIGEGLEDVPSHRRYCFCLCFFHRSHWNTGENYKTLYLRFKWHVTCVKNKSLLRYKKL